MSDEEFDEFIEVDEDDDVNKENIVYQSVKPRKKTKTEQYDLIRDFMTRKNC